MKRAWTSEAMHNIKNDGAEGSESDLQQDINQGIHEMRIPKSTIWPSNFNHLSQEESEVSYPPVKKKSIFSRSRPTKIIRQDVDVFFDEVGNNEESKKHETQEEEVVELPFK